MRRPESTRHAQAVIVSLATKSKTVANLPRGHLAISRHARRHVAMPNNRGGNRHCEVLGCSRVMAPAEVHFGRKLCHPCTGLARKIVLARRAGPKDRLRRAISKVHRGLGNEDPEMPKIFVRSWNRPHAISTKYTTTILRNWHLPFWLVVACSDPHFESYGRACVDHGLLHCLLVGPKGADNVVAFCESLLGADQHLVIMDDNVVKIGMATSKLTFVALRARWFACFANKHGP